MNRLEWFHKVAVYGTPSAFDMLSWFPFMRKGFTPIQLSILAKLVGFINLGLFYSSDGKTDLNKLRETSFAPTTELVAEGKAFHKLAEQMNLLFFTNKKALFNEFLPKQEIMNRINALRSSEGFSQMPTLPGSSPAIPFVTANPKEKISQFLQALEQVS